MSRDVYEPILDVSRDVIEPILDERVIYIYIFILRSNKVYRHTCINASVIGTHTECNTYYSN